MKEKSSLQIAFDQVISQIKLYQYFSRPVFTPHDPKRYFDLARRRSSPLGIHQNAERSRDVGGRKPPEFSRVSSAAISRPA